MTQGTHRTHRKGPSRTSNRTSRYASANRVRRVDATMRAGVLTNILSAVARPNRHHRSQHREFNKKFRLSLSQAAGPERVFEREVALSDATHSGYRAANSTAIAPPIECPTTCTGSVISPRMNSTALVSVASPSGLSPYPGKSGQIQREGETPIAANRPWMNTIAIVLFNQRKREAPKDLPLNSYTRL